MMVVETVEAVVTVVFVEIVEPAAIGGTAEAVVDVGTAKTLFVVPELFAAAAFGEIMKISTIADGAAI